MKTTLNYIALLVVLQIIFANAKANDICDVKSDAAKVQWQLYPGGISIALDLISNSKNAAKKSSLQIYIKNASTSNWVYLSSGQDNGVRISYVNDHGADIALRDYNSEADNLNNRLPPLIKSGNIICVSIDLNPKEVALIKTHPVTCNFVIYNQVDRQRSSIKTNPQQLVEVSD